MDYSAPPPLVDAYPPAADPLYPIAGQDPRSGYYVASPQIQTHPSLSGLAGASNNYPYPVGAPGATPYAGPGYVLSPSVLTPNATPYIPAGAGGMGFQPQTPATLYAAYPYPQPTTQGMAMMSPAGSYLSPSMNDMDIPPSQRQRPTGMRSSSGSRSRNGGGGGGGGGDTDWAYYQQQAETLYAQQQERDAYDRERMRAEDEAHAHARRAHSARSRSRSRYDRHSTTDYYDTSPNPNANAYPTTTPGLRRSGEALDTSWAFAPGDRGQDWDGMSASTSTSALIPSPQLSRSRSLYGTGSGPRPQYARPMEWREEFKPPKQGLARLFSGRGKESLSRNLLSFLGRTQIHPSLEHRSPPTLHWDIRFDPSFALTQRSRTDPNFVRFAGLELQEPATDPPSHFMRFMHAALPWYVTIDTSWAGAAVTAAGGGGGGGDGFPYGYASGPGGYGPGTSSYSLTDSATGASTRSGSASPHTIITIGHLLYTLYLELRQPIDHADYYNDAMDQRDREVISQAWMRRCNGSEEEAVKGVRRVDFLGERCVFEGLVKRGEVWEVKTGRGRR